jgi:hypothetical protein
MVVIINMHDLKGPWLMLWLEFSTYLVATTSTQPVHLVMQALFLLVNKKVKIGCRFGYEEKREREE